MPRCNSRIPVFLLLALAFVLAYGAVPATPQAPSPVQPESQPPLNVDRDPVAAPAASPAAATPVPAQPQAGTPQAGATLTRNRNGQFILQKNVEEVVMYATVFDEKQRLVTNLTKDDFKVYEDGVLQTISSFQHQDIPISLGILVDNSGSMRTKRQAVNSSALDLVHFSNPQDETFIVNFSDEAYIDQDFTSDVNKLRDGLSHIDSKGGTALYDAIMASADYLARNAKHPKQVLLVITDGEDNASSTTLEETVRRIQSLEGPVVYCIGLLYDDEDGGREAHRAKRALQVLADETGGIAFFPKSLDEVDDIAGEVARDIRQQYTIGYHSTKPSSEGGFRVVHMEAKAKGEGKLTVRTRTGYYPYNKSDTTAAARQEQIQDVSR